MEKSDFLLGEEIGHGAYGHVYVNKNDVKTKLIFKNNYHIYYNELNGLLKNDITRNKGVQPPTTGFECICDKF